MIPTKRWKAVAILIGIGLALVPIHNRFITDLTTVNGQVLVFVPTFGYVLLAVGMSLFLFRHWGQVKEVGCGSKRVWICLLYTSPSPRDRS